MKIAMITSWDRECGIYSYTRPLVEQLRRQGHDVQVVCHQDARLGESIHPVIDQANPAWFEAVDSEVAGIGPDVVHVQFEYGLYSYRRESPFPPFTAADSFGMNDLLFRWKTRGQPAVVTMHSDNSQRPDRIAFIQTMGQLPAVTLLHTEHAELPSGKFAIVPHVAPVAKGIRGDKARYGWQGKKVAGMIGYPDWYKRYERMVALWPRVLEQMK
ncbi:MAG: hypothetical protein KGJ86_11985, partial [Chloroflexota bacterium]|nr:hypothetical protein [Chloroflexota bacterium]